MNISSALYIFKGTINLILLAFVTFIQGTFIANKIE